MHYTSAISDLIRERKSCRSYGSLGLEESQGSRLRRFLSSLEEPFWRNIPRFDIVRVGPPGKGRMPGTYGMIKGAGEFLVGAVARGHRELEDYGYLFEKIILFATDLGLANCWIGLTIAREPLAEKINLQPDESIPTVSPLGYPAKRRSLVDKLTRSSLGAARRKPWQALFFNESWDRPLEKAAVGDYGIPLEMVRLAPSSTNKQPWRIVRSRGAFHFFLQRSPGYAMLTSAADLQRIDMGIAMCHFEMAAKEMSLGGYWMEVDEVPIFPLPKQVEYVVSWVEN